MTIRFTKMHGLGNDFIVIDAVHQSINLQPNQVSALAKRDTGIGFDQCLIIEAPRTSTTDFYYRIFNADGQEVGQCGNGARCIARFASYYGLTNKKNIVVATYTTTMHLLLNDDNSVTVNMGKPNLEPITIPFLAERQEQHYSLSLLDGSTCQIHAVNVGNPHAIQLVPDINQVNIQNIGKQISTHSLFPEHANASFMQISSNNKIHLRVYERGSGETQACGSAAVAAAAIARLYYNCDANITVGLPGGDLFVNWPNISESIYLTGPATFVYEGVLLPCV